MLCFFILNGILQVCIFLYCIKFINFQVLIHSSFKFCRCNLDILTETRDGEAREFWELRVPPYCFFFGQSSSLVVAGHSDQSLIVNLRLLSLSA